MKTDKQSWWYHSTSKLSLKSALFRIVLSTVCVSGTAAFGFSYYRHLQGAKAHDPKYHIVALVQTGVEKEQLKTVYLAELLGLSIDHPHNLFTYDVLEAEKKLLACPLIKRAVVKKVSPGTLYVDYTIRKPLAFSGDYSNTAIDEEGVLIPFKPFFTPKKLPEIIFYKGRPKDVTLQDTLWGTSLSGPEFERAFAVINYCNEKYSSRGMRLMKVDVSNAMASSYGQREIVLEFEEVFQGAQFNYFKPLLLTTLVRLNEGDVFKSIDRYALLRGSVLHKIFVQAIHGKESMLLRFDPVVIDLRITDLAFISQ